MSESWATSSRNARATSSESAARAARASRRLLESDLGETSELARMQAFPILGLELFQRPQPDLEVLADALPIELQGPHEQVCRLFEPLTVLRIHSQELAAAKITVVSIDVGRPAVGEPRLFGWA